MFKVKESKDYEVIKDLFKEYSQIKGAEGCFVSFDKEISDLGGFYEGGAILLGFENEIPIACIAIRKMDNNKCEGKRLFIKPEYRGKGYARKMMNAMLEEAKKLGFKELVFTTRPEVMAIGYGLYKRMGFEELKCEDGVASMRMIL
ncbi:MAG: GNAT family N-acetyltransferase [Lachnospiraceae bacterium]|nr:GNAT family N-acetyltransferase [Lachnospiraceae bacterium]